MGFMSAPVAAGEFTTYLKYDARAGRFYTKPDGGGDLYEVDNMTAAMDLENIRTGWFHYMEGQAPTKVFDPSLSEAAPRPNPEAKRGFEVLLFSEKNIGGLREFSSTAAVVINAMNDLYDQWTAAKDANPGKVPVVRSEGVSAVKASKSTNYAPALKIVAWADRPAEFSNEAGTAAPVPKQAPAAHTPPPAPVAPVDDDAAVF